MLGVPTARSGQQELVASGWSLEWVVGGLGFRV